MRVVAIVDCGRARWKMRAWRLTSDQLPQLVGSKVIDEPGGAEDAEAVARWSSQARDWLDQAQVHEAIAISGALMRADARLRSIFEDIVAVEPLVLTKEDEAELLAEAVLPGLSRSDEATVVDIGGGSVQIVSARGGSPVSVPLGTYSIEEQFELPQGSPRGRYETVLDSVSTSLSAALAGRQAGSTLVVGSNLYGTFFRGLETMLGLRLAPSTTSSAPVGPLSRAEVEAAFVACQDLSESEFKILMPVAPGFMLGAEKGLLVTLALMRTLGATHAYGTDLGITDGLLSKMAGAGLGPS